jgi:hypothetical protein
MFGYDGYTLAEVAELFDCPEEVIVAALSHNPDFAYKKYVFFGPTLYRKYMVDGIASDVRSDGKRLGLTRADIEASRQNTERVKQENKQHEENIVANRELMIEQLQAFYDQAEEMVRRKIERDNQ